MRPQYLSRGVPTFARLHCFFIHHIRVGVVWSNLCTFQRTPDCVVVLCCWSDHGHEHNRGDELTVDDNSLFETSGSRVADEEEDVDKAHQPDLARPSLSVDQDIPGINIALHSSCQRSPRCTHGPRITPLTSCTPGSCPLPICQTSGGYGDMTPWLHDDLATKQLSQATLMVLVTTGSGSTCRRPFCRDGANSASTCT